MKQLSISVLFLFLVCAGLSSCSKDDDDDAPTPKSLIVGKWYVNKAVVTEYTGTTVTNTTTTASYTAEDFFELQSDGKYLYPIEGQAALEVGSYVLNDAGTMLSLHEEDDVDDYDVDELTGNTLVISQTFTYTEAGVPKKVIEVITHSKTASK